MVERHHNYAHYKSNFAVSRIREGGWVHRDRTWESMRNREKKSRKIAKIFPKMVIAKIIAKIYAP